MPCATIARGCSTLQPSEKQASTRRESAGCLAFTRCSAGQNFKAGGALTIFIASQRGDVVR
jgi:hypothetical protein